MNDTETLKAATERVRLYFGSSLRRLEADTLGNMVMLDITYEDFHTLKRVRSWLNENIPSLLQLSVERTYSDAAIESVSCGNTDDPDELVMVEELLFSKELADGECQQ